MQSDVIFIGLRHIRVGRLCYPAANFPEILTRFCRQLFIQQEPPNYPVCLKGSGVGLQIGRQLLVACCRHQLNDDEPRNVLFRFGEDETDNLISSCGFVQSDSHADHADLNIFQFSPEMPITNIHSYFFPYVDTWAGKAQHYFVLGFPFDLQDFETDRLYTRLVATDATYERPSNAPYVHRIKMSRNLKWRANGLSGAPVFYLDEDDAGYFVGLAGLINRGGDASCPDAYFIEARCLLKYMRSLPSNQRPT